MVVENFFLDQSIGIDESYTFQLTFLSSIKIVGSTDLGGLWALEWAWHIRVTNLRCYKATESKSEKKQFSIFNSF